MVRAGHAREPTEPALATHAKLEGERAAKVTAEIAPENRRWRQVA